MEHATQDTPNQKRPYSPEEDELIIQAIDTRPNSMTQKQAISEILDQLNDRSTAAAIFRYYYIKQYGKNAQEPAEPEPETEPNARLTVQATELLQSITKLVEENNRLREENARFQEEQARQEYNVSYVMRLQSKIRELEEDQEHFLKLMEKARRIGRIEENI